MAMQNGMTCFNGCFDSIVVDGRELNVCRSRRDRDRCKRSYSSLETI